MIINILAQQQGLGLPPIQSDAQMFALLNHHSKPVENSYGAQIYYPSAWRSVSGRVYESLPDSFDAQNNPDATIDFTPLYNTADQSLLTDRKLLYPNGTECTHYTDAGGVRTYHLQINGSNGFKTGKKLPMYYRFQTPVSTQDHVQIPIYLLTNNVAGAVAPNMPATHQTHYQTPESSVTVTGTAEAGCTIDITHPAGTYSGTVDANGEFSVVVGGLHTVGLYPATVVATNEENLQSEPLHITLERTPPPPPPPPAYYLEVTQPTPGNLSGSIVAYPSSGYRYSINGGAYQTSNQFHNLGVGMYQITLQSTTDGTVLETLFAEIDVSQLIEQNNYHVQVVNNACPGLSQGQIVITAKNSSLLYTLHVSGDNYTPAEHTFYGTKSIYNLPAGKYNLCLGIKDLAGYQQCLSATITEPEPLAVYSAPAPNDKSVRYFLSGGSQYFVTHNGNTFVTNQPTVDIELQPGINHIRIGTDRLCQGEYMHSLVHGNSGMLTFYPNPAKDEVHVLTSALQAAVEIKITSLSGGVAYRKNTTSNQDGVVVVDISSLPKGIYLIQSVENGSCQVGKLVKE